jgi:hypothetical protein
MADDDFDLEPVVPRRQMKKKKKKKGGALKVGLIVLLILLVLIGLVAAGAWYFWLSEWYGTGKGGETPVIRADQTPIKVKPKDPGGMAVPDRDKLVYKSMNGEGAPQGVERLLPPAEEPAEPPAAMPEAQTAPAPVATAPAPTAGAPAPVAPTAPAPPPMPAPKVLTAPGSEQAAASAPKPAPEKGQPVALAPKPLDQNPATPTTKAKSLPSQPAPKPSAQPAPKPRAAVSAGSYRIQLGAVRSADRARQEWRRLQTKHKDVLGALSLDVQRADLGAKGVYYRLRAGPFADADRASAACVKLKARKVPCFPVAPGK